MQNIKDTQMDNSCCSHNQEIKRFSLHEQKMVFHCGCDSCPCSKASFPSKKYSIRGTIDYFKWKETFGHSCYQQVVQYYNSLVESLVKQRDLLINKINNKESCLKHSEAEFLHTLEMAQSKKLDELTEMNLVFTSPLSLESSFRTSSCSQDHNSEKLKKQLKLGLTHPEFEFDRLCSSLRRIWSTGYGEGMSEFAESRGQMGAQGHQMAHKDHAANKYHYSTKVESTNYQKLMQQQVPDNLIEARVILTRDNIQNIMFYSPKISKISISKTNTSLFKSSAPMHPFNLMNMNMYMNMNRGPNPQAYPMLPPPPPPSLQCSSKFLPLINQYREALQIISKTSSIASLNCNLRSEAPLNQSKIIDKVSTFTHLKELVITGIQKLTNAHINKISTLRILEKLSIIQQSRDDTGSDLKIDSLSALPNLRSLLLEEINCQQFITSDFSLLKSLEEIGLVSVFHIQDITMKQICAIPKLKILKIHNCHQRHIGFNEDVSDEDETDYANDNVILVKRPRKVQLTFEKLFSYISNCENLEELNICQFDNNERMSQGLLENLSKISKLKVLSIENLLPDFEQIIWVLKRFRLQVLDLAVNQRRGRRGIGNQQFTSYSQLNKEKFFKQVMQLMPDIVELRLDGHLIKNKWAMIIGTKLKKIKRLSLCECKIGTAGVLYLSKLPLLEGLYLGSELCSRPLPIINNCPRLLQLRIDNINPKYFFVKNNVRNQYLAIHYSTIINLKSLAKKSEFPQIQYHVEIPLIQQGFQPPPMMPFPGMPRFFTKPLFRSNPNRYDFTNEKHIRPDQRIHLR